MIAMATEPDKGKGKENENEIDPVKQSTPWTGRLQDGKWFCDCNRRARCFTVTKVSSPNHGKKCKLHPILPPYLVSNSITQSGHAPKLEMTNAPSLSGSREKRKQRSGI